MWNKTKCLKKLEQLHSAQKLCGRALITIKLAAFFEPDLAETGDGRSDGHACRSPTDCLPYSHLDPGKVWQDQRDSAALEATGAPIDAHLLPVIWRDASGPEEYIHGSGYMYDICMRYDLVSGSIGMLTGGRWIQGGAL